MPMRRLNVFSAMLDRIAAEEEQTLMLAVAAGSGSLPKSAHHQYVNELRSRVRGRLTGKQQARQDRRALMAAGVVFTQEPRGG
jgi:hypothetical protein